MTSYRVLVSETAISQLKLLDMKQTERIREALRNLEHDPFRSRSGADIKKLNFPLDPPLFRLRIGKYRAIYFVVKGEVRVTEIIHRSKGYNWLG
ncbi:MAG: type II toxin-antitoxin system RelE/ParE family toxin [Candidatus Thorarchaeota archaeon]